MRGKEHNTSSIPKCSHYNSYFYRMEEFLEYVLQFCTLNQQQIALISKKSVELELHKDEYFSEAGKVPKQVGFLVEGVVRGCYYNNKGEEITRYFASENHLMYDYINFDAGTASSEYLQACTNCKLIVFSKRDWEELLGTIVGWDNVSNKMIQLCVLQKYRKAPVISQDATTRYLDFLKNFPALANRIPLKYLASYLGVTDTSLSRIRKNIR